MWPLRWIYSKTIYERICFLYRFDSIFLFGRLFFNSFFFSIRCMSTRICQIAIQSHFPRSYFPFNFIIRLHNIHAWHLEFSVIGEKKFEKNYSGFLRVFFYVEWRPLTFCAFNDFIRHFFFIIIFLCWQHDKVLCTVSSGPALFLSSPLLKHRQISFG